MAATLALVELIQSDGRKMSPYIEALSLCGPRRRLHAHGAEGPPVSCIIAGPPEDHGPSISKDSHRRALNSALLSDSLHSNSDLDLFHADRFGDTSYLVEATKTTIFCIQVHGRPP